MLVSGTPYLGSETHDSKMVGYEVAITILP